MSEVTSYPCDMCGNPIPESMLKSGERGDLWLGKQIGHLTTRHLCADCRYSDSPMPEIVKHRLTWEDNAVEFKSYLWLPKGCNPLHYISDIVYQLAHVADEEPTWEVVDDVRIPRYNHLLDVAFTIETPHSDALDIPKKDILDALQRRLNYLKAHPEECAEAFGHNDSFEVVQE